MTYMYIYGQRMTSTAQYRNPRYEAVKLRTATTVLRTLVCLYVSFMEVLSFKNLGLEYSMSFPMCWYILSSTCWQPPNSTHQSQYVLEKNHSCRDHSVETKGVRTAMLYVPYYLLLCGPVCLGFTPWYMVKTQEHGKTTW